MVQLKSKSITCDMLTIMCNQHNQQPRESPSKDPWDHTRFPILKNCCHQQSNQTNRMPSYIMYAFLLDWKRLLNYLATVHQYVWLKCTSGCLAFSRLFEGVDIAFVYCITGDNGRYTLANISAAVLLANFSSLHLHNQRYVRDYMPQYCSA